jgi:hypothetical protein
VGLLEDRAVVPSIDQGDGLVDAANFEVRGDLWLISIFFRTRKVPTASVTL